MNKKIFAILIVLICALSISAVSATDDSAANDVATIADAGNFADLNTAISGANGTLDLDKNYTNAGSESAITIGKDITIDGKNHVINADNKSTIFIISAGKTVTIKNLIFINGYSKTANGGAINNTGTLILDNCKFINNTASTRGGAIHSTGTLTVTGSLFDGNDIYTRTGRASNDYGGAAIFNDKGTLNIDNAVFKNNLKNYKEGVEYFVGTVTNIDGNTTIKNSEFLNNSGRFGGCIYSGYNKAILKVNNTKFTNNTGLYGGAIYAESSTFDITYCNFTSNKVSGEGDMSPNSNNGGALSTNANVKGNIANCIFTANSGHMGGAVYLESGNVNVTNCKFNNNRATNFTNKGKPVAGRGGAISIDNGNPNKANAIITDCDFNDNSAYLGGAIFNSQNSTFENDNFVNNTSPIASAMYNSGGNLKLENITASEGQIIYNNKGSINSTVIITVLNNETIDVKYGEKINLTATITADGIPVIQGNLTFKVNGTDVYAIFDGEKYIANYTVDFGNTQTVTAVYKDTKATVKNATLVSKYNSEITVDEIQNIKTTDNLTVTGTLTIAPTYAVEGLNVTVAVSSVDGNTTTVVANKTVAVGADGKFSVNMGTLNKGNYVVVAAFDKEGFASSTSNKTYVNVTKIATSITVSDINVTVGQNTTLTGTTTGIADNSTVTISVGKVKNRTVTVKDNKFSLDLIDLVAGVFNITVTYDGDDKYEAATANATLTVNKLPTSITVKPIDKIAVGGNITVQGNTTGIANNTQITITVNGKEYTTTVVDGKYLKNITNVTPEGTAKVTVSYNGTDKLAPAEASVNVTVGRDSSIIKFDNITAIVGENVTITGTTVPANIKFNVTIGKNTYNVTSANGTFSLNIGKFAYGNQTIVAKYAGDANYTASTTTVTFTVAKKATSINITNINVTTKDKITVNGTTAGIANNSTIKVTIGNDVKFVNVTNDKFSVTFDAKKAGSYTITATYDGTADYAPAEATANLTVSKSATSITITDVVIFAGQNATINGTVTAIPTNATIKVTVGNKTVEAKVNGGKFSAIITGLTVGKYNVTAVYAGNDDFDASNATANLTVIKYPTVTTIVNITSSIQAGDRLLVTATVTSESKPIDGTVILLVNGKQVANATLVNGTAKFNETINAGNRTVMVKFVATDKYEESNATANVVVKGTDATMEVPDVTLYFKNGTQLLIFVKSNGTNISNETVVININGVDYERTVRNGTAKFTINLAPGTYNVTVTLESKKYNLITKNATVTVLPVIAGNDTVLYFKNGTKYQALFLDGQGKPLNGTKVQFNINGVLYERTTDANGTARITINLAPGVYEITAINPANGAMHANNITVLSTIKGNDTVLYYKNGTRYQALFLDGQGNPLNGAKVQFNINGVMYDRTVKLGTAGLAINLAPGKYTITAINSYNGQMYANNITVLPTVVSEDLTKYYKNESKYIVKVVDGQGNGLANQTVTYNINGVFYERTTNATGHAKFSINLAAGNSEPNKYVITAMANGCTVSNTVTVLPVLIGEDFTEPQGAGKRFTVNVLDGQGKPQNGTKVQFNINGVLYNRTSNVNGTAGLAINLQEGQYIITAMRLDNGATISNKVTVTAKA